MSLYFIVLAMHRFFGDLCILPLSDKIAVYVGLLLATRDAFADTSFISFFLL